MAVGTNRKCIAVVDHDDVTRTSIAQLLHRYGFSVKAFKSGDAFLATDSLDNISCVLLDLQMQGRDGRAVLRALAERSDSPPILAFAARSSAVEAIRLGAQDVIEKPNEGDALVARIEEAIRRHGRAGSAGGVDAEAVALIGALSGRQRQVLDGILKGLQNKNIAYELGLSIRTVEAYRAQLLERLGARGTAEAVQVALAAGLTGEPSLPGGGTQL